MGNMLEIFRKVNEITETYYGHQQRDHSAFLSECHKELSSHFIRYFNNDTFIFSALSYSVNNMLHHVDEHKEQDKDKSYLFNKKQVKGWQILKHELREYKKQVKKGEMISMTKLLLDKINIPLKDLFFICSESVHYSQDIINEKIFEYALKNFNLDKEIYRITNHNELNRFYKSYKNESNDWNAYVKYVWNHHKLAELYKSHNENKDFVLHYIKPSIKELDYGLLLSLATNRPLTTDELTFVNLILYRIVSQTKTEKMKEERITDLIQTTYSLGHNLKNRLIDSDKLMKDLVLDISDSSLDCNEKEELVRNANNVSKKINSLFNTGKILDLTGRFMTENKWEENWLTDNCLNICSFIETFENDTFIDINMHGKYAKINIEGLSKKLIIEKWLNEDTRRPADFVYEELFFEMFINALNYGKEYIDNDRKYVDIFISSEGNDIKISNTTFKEIKNNEKFKHLSKGIPIKPNLIRHGGLRYMFKFLSQTETGDIDIVLDKENNIFTVVLKLKGISNGK